MFDEDNDAITPANVPKFRPELAYPKLTEEMSSRLRAYGEEKALAPNATLFERGGRKGDLFLVIEGRIEVFVPHHDGTEESLYALESGQFSGGLDLLTSQRTLASGRTLTECVVLRVPRQELRQLMRSEGDIANLIMQAAIWRRLGLVANLKSGVVLIGDSDHPETLLLQRFLIRNGFPCKVSESAVGYDTTPVVILDDGRALERPSIPQLADELGITEQLEADCIYDVTVVGAGPGGLAAGVYAASEGLTTLVIEGIAPGGQAGTSSKIENYLGFPTGISGQRLAHRAHVQALKFGAHFAISRDVVALAESAGIHTLVLAGGEKVRTRSLVVATGAMYRKLDIDDYSRFENCGVYYAATAMESALCASREVIVVGGGNSAGQAALFLSGIASHVHLVVRAKSLATTMSQYLVSRIEGSDRITLHVGTRIDRMEGGSKLERVVLFNRIQGQSMTMTVRTVFVMIGAEPNTGWLFGAVELDRKGFVVTGSGKGFENSPYASSLPGVYAVGDVRSGSVKRVASAVGEGSVVVSDVHRYLASRRDQVPANANSALAALQAAGAPHDTEVSRSHGSEAPDST